MNGGEYAIRMMAAEPDESGQDENQVSEAADITLKLNKTSLSLGVVGQTEKLTVTVTPAEAASDLKVTWKSSDTSVVKVSGDGTLNAKGQAQATVTEAYSGKSGKKSADITVTISSQDGESDPVEASCKVTVSLYNGVYQDPNGSSRYYYQNGKVSSVTDVKKINGTWYNLKKGKVVGNTVAKNKNGWWYIDKNGEVDFTYNGFGKNGNGSWYCENGKVTFKKQGILKDTTGALGEKGAWYYVIDSKVQTEFTGLSNFRNEHGWWYIKNGKVDFTHNGVDKNKNGWWYVKNGKVDFSANTVAKNKNGWWYVVGGKVQFGFTGLADYKNSSGWWYIKNGKVDFTYNGIASNKNGFWYVRKGKVDFSYNGTCTIGGMKYKVTKGKVNTEVNGYGRTISGGQLTVLTGNKGLMLSRTPTQEEFYQIVGKFMTNSYVKNKRYCMSGGYAWKGGTRWDCSAMTTYFLNYYLLTYDQAYNSAAKADASAKQSDLVSTALASVGKLAADTRFTPQTAVNQAMAWGNPVYTYKTVGQLSADNPGNLRYGDLLFYGEKDGDSVRITHVAIYLGQYYLDSGDTGYYVLEDSDGIKRGMKEGRSDGVRIDSFYPIQINNVLVHATRIF